MGAALKLLSFRARTVAELAGRLEAKGFDRDLAAGICDSLRERGYLDDRQFAVSWVKSCCGSRCRNGWVLKKELRAKGVPPALADEVVDETCAEEELFKAACKLASLRIKRAGERDAGKLKARVQNLLLRRGFDYDFIRRVLAKTMPD